MGKEKGGKKKKAGRKKRAKAAQKAAEKKALSKATAKIVKKRMKKEAKKAKKKAKKAAKKAAKAILKGVVAKKTKKKFSPVKTAEKVFNAAKKAHLKTLLKLRKARVKAEKLGVKFQATTRASAEVRKAVAAAKKVPVSDDDLKKNPRLSALEWAKKAAHDKLLAYRDHMAAARAADKEAGIHMALHSAEAQLHQLKREASRDAIEARSLRGVASTMRYAESQAHAKARFTLRGKLTKTKYQEMSENYKDKVKVKNRELKETLKQ